MAAREFFIVPYRIVDWSEHARTRAQEIREWQADEIADIRVQYLSGDCYQSTCAVLEGSPLVVADKTLAQRFREQADKWQKETQHLSSPGQRMMHPSYQAILGMGNENRREIIYLMIRDMQQHRRPWFWALSYLAQDNPVSQSDAGNMDRIIKAWIDWEKAQRLP